MQGDTDSQELRFHMPHGQKPKRNMETMLTNSTDFKGGPAFKKKKDNDNLKDSVFSCFHDGNQRGEHGAVCHSQMS